LPIASFQSALQQSEIGNDSTWLGYRKQEKHRAAAFDAFPPLLVLSYLRNISENPVS
jgi:hypothetical protein